VAVLDLGIIGFGVDQQLFELGLASRDSNRWRVIGLVAGHGAFGLKVH
jgi:hypothetical protein